MSKILEMYRPMLDIQIARYGFGIEHNVLFIGNDHLSTQIEEITSRFNMPEGILNEIFNNTDKTYITECIDDYEVVIQIYDFAPGGFALNGISGE